MCSVSAISVVTTAIPYFNKQISIKIAKETIDKLAYPGVSAPYSFSFDKKSRNTRNNVSLTVQSCRIVLRRFLKISAIDCW